MRDENDSREGKPATRAESMSRLTRQGICASLLVGALCCVEGARPFSPRFTEQSIPEPPLQKRPWDAPKTSLPQVFISATRTLFDQGLADPRGCRYREIKVGTGDCWNGDAGVVTTHGWVLPEQKNSEYTFAVCWNGLVYPVVSVGDQADLRADVLALIADDEAMRARHAKEHPDWPRYRFRHATGEGRSVAHDTILPIKASLLFRLGEVELAEKLWAAWVAGMRRGTNDDDKHLDDPYLMLATDWTWALFDRAVCAHMRRDDNLALISARLLVPAWNAIEKTADARGFEHGYTREGETPRHLAFLSPIHALLKDQERRAKAPRKPSTPGKKRDIAGMIEALDEVSARQWMQPGGVSFGMDGRITALIAAGDEAVEPLLRCLGSDTRLTRSVQFHRDFHRHRSLIGVHEAAYVALRGILKTSFFGVPSWGDGLPARGQEGRKAAAARIRAYWTRFKDVPLAERWYRTLAQDDAPASLWLQAAQNITRPADVSAIPGSMYGGGGATIPSRKPGEAPPLTGESLRKKVDPSVSELMARRVDALSVTKAASSEDMFRMHKACDMALALAQWDPQGAAPVLRQQIERCRALYATGWNRTDWTTQRLATYMADFTIELARQGDEEALRNYAAWLRARTPEQIDEVVRSAFEPVWRFPENAALAEAADAMFNRKGSPWRPLNHTENGSSFPARDLFETPLIVTPAFRKHVLHFLQDKRKIGKIRPRTEGRFDIQIEGGWSTSTSSSQDDPLAPEPGTEHAIRLCDVYAYELSQLQGTPGIQFYWPERERDNVVAATAAFIRQYGARYRVPAPGTEWLDRPSLVFTELGRPATREDVANGRAIFSLEGRGQTRQWPMPKRPMDAEWPSCNVFPRYTAHWDPKTKKSIRTVYRDTKGKVWQAEEVFEDGTWKRYFGFAGRYCVATVAAQDVEFAAERPWQKMGGGLDCQVSRPGMERRDGIVTIRSLDVGDPLPVTVKLRNRLGVTQTVPSAFYRADDEGGPSLRSGIELSLRRRPLLAPPGDHQPAMRREAEPEQWTAVPAKRTSRFRDPGRGRPLEPCEELVAFTVDLNDWFDIREPGRYRLQITFSSQEDGFIDGKTPETTFCLVLPTKDVRRKAGATK